MKKQIEISEIALAVASLVESQLNKKSISARPEFDQPLRDVGVDSLSMISVLLAIEGQFAISFPDESLTVTNFRSVSSISNLILKLLMTDDLP